MPENINIHPIFQSLPSYREGNIAGCYNCNNEAYMVLIQNTTKEYYDKYISALEDEDYICYDKYSLRDNYFATFHKGSLLVQIYFTAHDNTVHLIADPNTSLLTSRQASPILEQCDTTLYQLELDYRKIDCGMCYVTQCADYSFFIIDSAHMDSPMDHERLYKLLKHLTPKEQPIVISGWFFSHAHQDHIYMFMKFLESNFTNYKIECLYYNFPSLSIPGSQTWKEADKVTMREFNTLIEQHKEIPVVKLHTGQRFSVRNLDFNVLSTHEDLYPAPLTCFNDSSTILLMSVKGTRTLFLGDGNVGECTILVSRYGSAIAADIVQVAHHGYNGSNVGIYYCANAKTALYPAPLYKYDLVKASEANKTVLKISTEIYIAGEGMAAFPFPYKPGLAKVYPKEL